MSRCLQKGVHIGGEGERSEGLSEKHQAQEEEKMEEEDINGSDEDGWRVEERDAILFRITLLEGVYDRWASSDATRWAAGWRGFQGTSMLLLDHHIIQLHEWTGPD